MSAVIAQRPAPPVDPVFHCPEVSRECRADLVAAVEALPVIQLLGFEVRGFDERGACVLLLPLRPKVKVGPADARSSFVFPMIEHAGLAAAASLLPPDSLVSTVNLQVTHLQTDGWGLMAIGRATVDVNSALVLATIEVWSAGLYDPRLLATGTTTCRYSRSGTM